MIDLSTQTIFCDGIPSALWKWTQVHSSFWNVKSHLYSMQIWFPSNATLIQIYLLLFILVKKRVTVGRCCTSSTKRAALHYIYSHYPLRLLISKNCFFCGRVLSNNSPEEWFLLTIKVICTAPFGEIQYKLSDNARPMIL